MRCTLPSACGCGCCGHETHLSHGNNRVLSLGLPYCTRAQCAPVQMGPFPVLPCLVHRRLTVLGVLPCQRLLKGPVARWRGVYGAAHMQLCERRGPFTRHGALRLLELGYPGTHKRAQRASHRAERVHDTTTTGTGGTPGGRIDTVTSGHAMPGGEGTRHPANLMRASVSSSSADSSRPVRRPSAPTIVPLVGIVVSVNKSPILA
jgi:hypothetical protein